MIYSLSESDRVFELLMREFGMFDYTYWRSDIGLVRSRGYYDGGWLEGRRVDLVVYWGA